MMMSGPPEGIKIVSEANLSCAVQQPDILARRTFVNLDPSGWSGGLATVLPQDHRRCQELGPAGGMKEELDLEEEEKRRVRRERNKLAAARCRKRRVEQIDGLQVTLSLSVRETLQQDIPSGRWISGRRRRGCYRRRSRASSLRGRIFR